MGTDGQHGTGLEKQTDGANLPKARTEPANSGMASTPLIAELPDGGTGERRSGVRRIPIEIDVAVPIHGFQVRDVLALNEGQLIVTRWMEGEDMPLAAHGTQLAWSEIEVIDQKLSVRITRLA